MAKPVNSDKSNTNTKPNTTTTNAPATVGKLPSDGKSLTDEQFNALMKRASDAFAAGKFPDATLLESIATEKANREKAASAARAVSLKTEVESLATKYGIDLETLANDVAGFAGVGIRKLADPATSKPRGKSMTPEALAEQTKVLEFMAKQKAKDAKDRIESVKAIARECGVDSSRVNMTIQKLKAGKVSLPTV